MSLQRFPLMPFGTTSERPVKRFYVCDYCQNIRQTGLTCSGQVRRGAGTTSGRPSCSERGPNLLGKFVRFRSNAVCVGCSRATGVNAEFESEPGHDPAGNGGPRLRQQEAVRHDRPDGVFEERPGTTS